MGKMKKKKRAEQTLMDDNHSYLSVKINKLILDDKDLHNGQRRRSRLVKLYSKSGELADQMLHISLSRQCFRRWLRKKLLDR